MQITNSKLKFTSDRAYYKLENLFNGDKVLGECLQFSLKKSVPKLLLGPEAPQKYLCITAER